CLLRDRERVDTGSVVGLVDRNFTEPDVRKHFVAESRMKIRQCVLKFPGFIRTVRVNVQARAQAHLSSAVNLVDYSIYFRAHACTTTGVDHPYEAHRIEVTLKSNRRIDFVFKIGGEREF